MDARRTQRVAETMREELSELIGYELQDPRLDAVTVTGVRLESHLRFADVLITCPGGEQKEKAALAALAKAQPRIRHLLAERLTIHKMPELRFIVDRVQAGSERLEVLLKRAADWSHEVKRDEDGSK